MFTHFLNFNINLLCRGGDLVIPSECYREHYIHHRIDYKKARLLDGILHEVEEGDSEGRLAHGRMGFGCNFGRVFFEWWLPIPIPRSFAIPVALGVPARVHWP